MISPEQTGHFKDGCVSRIYFAKISDFANEPDEENSAKRWFAIPIAENEKQNADEETFSFEAAVFFPASTD